MKNNKTLNGKAAIITGANQGLGLRIAEKYIEAGASVMIIARDGTLLQKAHDSLAKLKTGSQKVIMHQGDVSKESDVKLFVNKAISVFGECHILVNNAGVYGPMGQIEDIDWNEWVKAVEINTFGSILMCKYILPFFKSQGWGKIIQLSGGGATNPLPRISAYAASKAAVVRFTETLAEEVRGKGIDVNAIAPGALNTRILDEVLAAGPEKVGSAFYERSRNQKEKGGTSLELGADLAVFLASSASDGITGKLISAVWDNWHLWPKHLSDLNSSDVYTLRRIAGRDRSFSWGDK